MLTVASLQPREAVISVSHACVDNGKVKRRNIVGGISRHAAKFLHTRRRLRPLSLSREYIPHQGHGVGRLKRIGAALPQFDHRAGIIPFDLICIAEIPANLYSTGVRLKDSTKFPNRFIVAASINVYLTKTTPHTNV